MVVYNKACRRSIMKLNFREEGTRTIDCFQIRFDII